MKGKKLRAPKKKYFKLEYPTIINVLDNLTDKELGEYFKDIAQYELYGIEPESFSDRAVQMAFNMTARELDFQLEKHYGNQERGRENRSKGESTTNNSTNFNRLPISADNEEGDCEERVENINKLNTMLDEVLG